MDGVFDFFSYLNILTLSPWCWFLWQPCENSDPSESYRTVRAVYLSKVLTVLSQDQLEKLGVNLYF